MAMDNSESAFTKYKPYQSKELVTSRSDWTGIYMNLLCYHFGVRAGYIFTKPAVYEYSPECPLGAPLLLSSPSTRTCWCHLQSNRSLRQISPEHNPHPGTPLFYMLHSHWRTWLCPPTTTKVQPTDTGYACQHCQHHYCYCWLTRAMWLLFQVLLSTSVVRLAMPAIWYP